MGLDCPQEALSIPPMFSDEYRLPPSAPAVWLRRFAANDRGRDFVVGDLHGCVDELVALLAHARFNPKRDRLFSVGDLIDRGPRSCDALDLLDKPWFFAVRGNHEQMLLNHWSAPHEREAYDPHWLTGLAQDSVPHCRAQLSALPHVIKVGEAPDAFYVLHAELWDPLQLMTDEIIDRFIFSNETQTLSKALWSRHVLQSHWREPGRRYHGASLSRVFCGHTIVQAPLGLESSIYLDTGAFAPYVDQESAQAEHYGLSLVEARTLRHWFAPTCEHYRGTVVDLGKIDLSAGPPIPLDRMEPPEGAR
jgi:serine/threonine protein phosphatase 1